MKLSKLEVPPYAPGDEHLKLGNSAWAIFVCVRKPDGKYEKQILARESGRVFDHWDIEKVPCEQTSQSAALVITTPTRFVAR